MAADKTALRLLLLQIRDEQRVRREEYASFVRYSGLEAAQLDVHNVFDHPHFDGDILRDYDALIVGGASEASVLEPERFPFVPSSIALMQDCIEREVPVFASCFGFQLAVLALGGEIIRDTGAFEMGTLPITLTAAAAEDPVFRGVPATFLAVSVHRERAVELPQRCELLAFTDVCPHAFKVSGKPFWAFQFHPEVDKATLVERLTIYKQRYTDGDDHLQQILNAARDTPDANRLAAYFVDRVLCQG